MSAHTLLATLLVSTDIWAQGPDLMGVQYMFWFMVLPLVVSHVRVPHVLPRGPLCRSNMTHGSLVLDNAVYMSERVRVMGLIRIESFLKTFLGCLLCVHLKVMMILVIRIAANWHLLTLTVC